MKSCGWLTASTDPAPPSSPDEYSKHAAMGGFRSYIYVVEVACDPLQRLTLVVGSMSSESHHLHLAERFRWKCKYSCSVLIRLLTQPPLLHYLTFLFPFGGTRVAVLNDTHSAMSKLETRFVSIQSSTRPLFLQYLTFRFPVP